MKTKVKKEKKKYPYHRQKHNIFTQIRAREQRKALMLPNYAIIDEKGKIIEKYRLYCTAINERKKHQRDFFGNLRICKLDEYGNIDVVISK